jgi:hypothetical protein
MKNKFLGTLSVIALGLISSALWELLKPAVIGGWDWLLNLTSLGLQSLKDGIFANAARAGALGNQVHSVSTIVASIVALCAFCIVWVIETRDQAKAHWTGRRIAIALAVFSIALLAIGIRAQQATYIARNFETMLILAAPTLTDEALEQLRVEFIQVRSESDYNRLVESLLPALRKADSDAARALAREIERSK